MSAARLPGDYSVCADPAGCSEAAYTPFAACAKTMCAAEFTAYKAECKAFVDCYDMCDPCDDACTSACPLVDTDACLNADSAGVDCVFGKCALPALCDGSTKTCAELTTCCGTVADPDAKMACEATAATANNILCGNNFTIYCDL
jgi:hypothetical protein